MTVWFNIKLKSGHHEKNAPHYARLFVAADGSKWVWLSNGAYVAFVLSQEEARARYVISDRCEPEDSERLEKRWDWEQNR